MKRQRKAGIIFILIGVLLVGIGYLPSMAIFGSTSTQIVNPLPFDAFASQIQNQNEKIDQQNPLNAYIPEGSSTIDTTYNKIFYISFPSQHLKNIKVQANVNSNDAATYEKVLSQSAAHFLGTALPGEGGNTFIYGHSSVLWFHNLYPYSYEGIFSSLFAMKIGDPITVDFKGRTYNYVVEGITTIKATDFSQIQNITGINTLTLMTCSPPGVGENRLIVRAVEE